MAAILPNHWRPPITAGQRHVLHSGTPQARRGRGATTLVPWSRTVRARACPQGCRGPVHDGHVSIPPARSVSA